MHKLIYLLIAMIQLRAGSRIIEAVKAWRQFIKKPELIEQDKKVIVKIAKSESVKYKKDSGEEYTTQPRFRKIKFPKEWIKLEFATDLKFYSDGIDNIHMKKRVLDYLRSYFNCNTHSLRYAFINYMIYEQKRPINDVAKHVGHANIAQLVTYTQQKNSDQIFDLDV